MKRIPSPVLLYTIFFTGIATVLLGVLLPYIHAASSQEDLHTGWLLASQFIGQLIGALFVGRRPRVPLASVFCPLLCRRHSLSMGTQPRNTVLLRPRSRYHHDGRQHPRRARSHTGKARKPPPDAPRLLASRCPAAPWCVAAIARSLHPETACSSLAIALGFLLLLFFLNMRGASPASIAQETAEHPLPWYRLLLYCSIALLCVGVETALANWLPSYSSRSLSHTGPIAAAASLFWCAFSQEDSQPHPSSATFPGTSMAQPLPSPAS